MSTPVSNDVDILVSYLHQAAREMGTRDAVLKLLRAAQGWVIEAHGPPNEEDFTADDEPSLTILTHSLAFWAELERNATQDDWDEAIEDPIFAVVVLKGEGRDEDGTPIWWLRVTGEQAERFSDLPAEGQPVQLEIGENSYSAIVRYASSNRYAQVSPFVNLDETRIAVSSVLTNLGVAEGDTVRLLRVRNTIRVQRMP